MSREFYFLFQSNIDLETAIRTVFKGAGLAHGVQFRTIPYMISGSSTITIDAYFLDDEDKERYRENYAISVNAALLTQDLEITKALLLQGVSHFMMQYSGDAVLLQDWLIIMIRKSGQLILNESQRHQWTDEELSLIKIPFTQENLDLP